VQRFRPMDVSDDVFIAMIGNDAVCTTAQYEQVKMDRAVLAKKIADIVTTQLIDWMNARDTKNGYPQNDV